MSREAIPKPRRFDLAIVSVLLGILFAVAAAELALRVLAEPTLLGIRVRNTLLAPKDWDGLRKRWRALWDQASGDLTYQVYDPQLGWSPGASRSSANGLYFTSPEGIRAPRRGESPAPRTKHRIAILGDSFAFGEEVEYRDSFAAKLDATLGSQVQVLNFGVPGYGVDQAYLRYRRDVLEWDPDIVVLAFITDDLRRTMRVYNFISRPDWFPFSKPRGLPSADGVDWINVPTLRPEETLKAARPSDLPFLEYDIGYNAYEWNRTLDKLPFLVRFLVSKFWYLLPPKPNPNAAEAAIFGVNEAILREFTELARKEGSIPLVVFLAAREELDYSPSKPTLGQAFLKSTGIEHFDTTPCLLPLHPAERFTIKNPHYSPAANAAVAQCLADYIRPLFNERAEAPRPAEGVR